MSTRVKRKFWNVVERVGEKITKETSPGKVGRYNADDYWKSGIQKHANIKRGEEPCNDRFGSYNCTKKKGHVDMHVQGHDMEDRFKDREPNVLFDVCWIEDDGSDDFFASLGL